MRCGYEEGEEHSPIVNRQSPIEKALTPDALAALPKDVATELRQAVDDLDTNRANRSIDRIRQHNEALADALAELVKGFRFDLVQELFGKIGH